MGFLDMAAGAAGGLGGAVEKVGLSQVQAEIQRERDARLREWHNTDTVAAEGRAEARQIATEERGILNAPRAAEAMLPVEQKRAEIQSDVRVREREKTAAIDMQREIDTFKQLAPLKRQEIIDAEVARVKALASPDMLKATRAIAMASHIVDPSYTLIPNADGTVTTFDTKSGKSSGTLKDADGNAIVRKDPEEMKAAVSVINLANTNLKIAESAYKVDSTSLEPGAKEKAEIAWKEAQRQAREITAPAYAVLYGKAKIPGVTETPASNSGVATPRTRAEAMKLPPGTPFIDPDTGKQWTTKGAPAKAADSPAPATPAAEPPPAPRASGESVRDLVAYEPKPARRGVAADPDYARYRRMTSDERLAFLRNRKADAEVNASFQSQQ